MWRMVNTKAFQPHPKGDWGSWTDRWLVRAVVEQLKVTYPAGPPRVNFMRVSNVPGVDRLIQRPQGTYDFETWCIMWDAGAGVDPALAEELGEVCP
jgi:hypothetical protein